VLEPAPAPAAPDWPEAAAPDCGAVCAITGAVEKARIAAIRAAFFMKTPVEEKRDRQADRWKSLFRTQLF
jgi:hypothetical protein